nr:hypothetical protein [Tanacetum cinerariifolium]
KQWETMGNNGGSSSTPRLDPVHLERADQVY